MDNRYLIQARLARFWSIEEASKHVGVKKKAYERWEKGVCVPYLKNLGMLLKGFNEKDPEKLGYIVERNRIRLKSQEASVPPGSDEASSSMPSISETSSSQSFDSKEEPERPCTGSPTPPPKPNPQTTGSYSDTIVIQTSLVQILVQSFPDETPGGRTTPSVVVIPSSFLDPTTKNGELLSPSSGHLASSSSLSVSPQGILGVGAINSPSSESQMRSEDQQLGLLSQQGLRREVERYMATHDQSRRTLLQQFLELVSLSLPLLSSGAEERLARATKEIAALDETTINHYEQLTSLCWQFSEEDGLALIGQTIPEYLPYLTVLAKQKSKYQARIASITAQSHLLSYVTALHSQNFHLALSHCQDARTYSQLARDPNLEVVSILRSGNVYLYLKKPWLSLESYQEALLQVKGISPLVQTRLHAVMAEIQGKFGTEEDVRRSIGAASNALPSNMKDDPAARYIHFSKAGLYLHEGLAFLNLHQGKKAAAALEHVDGLKPKLATSERSRIDILVQQCWAAGQMGDLDMFCVHMEPAIDSARNLGSDLFLSEAWECYDRQSQWSKEERFRNLGKRFEKQD